MPESRTEGWGRDGGFSFPFTFLISIFRWVWDWSCCFIRRGEGWFLLSLLRLAYSVIRIDYS